MNNQLGEGSDSSEQKQPILIFFELLSSNAGQTQKLVSGKVNTELLSSV
ncbi:MAG: hypothetical protein RIC35_13350 [Marinoscillum sp.]